MFCPKCNNPLPDNSVACNRCGLIFQNLQYTHRQMPQQNQQYNSYVYQLDNNKRNASKKLVIGLIVGVMGVVIISILLSLVISYSPRKIDYGDAESFEQALNDGEDCVGMVVKVKIKDVKPNSFFGFNLWSGEHLNFLSNSNPGVGKGEYLTAKITKVDSMMGSWMIRYKIVKNAKETSDTKYKDK